MSEIDLERWQGRRYYPISQYFKAKFGERVAKISISVAESCPNRSGDAARQCIFCDEWGSAAYPRERNRELLEQIRHNRQLVSRRLKAKKFLVYFQSYTNTLDKVSTLMERFDLALSEDYVCGIVVGTRPDCLPARLMLVLRNIHEQSYMLVELGVQTFDDQQLNFLRRGHAAQLSVDAVHKLHEHAGCDIGIHLMFGLPGETDQQMIETAELVNSLPISNVKLHNLHVLANTPLANIYRLGEFTPLELDPYAQRVKIFLQHLSPDIAVQRLAALCSRWDDLVAPQWTREKMRPIRHIEGVMEAAASYQGQLFRG